MMYDKIIFLDMDGVVNSNTLIRNYCNNLEAKGLDPESIRKQFKEEFHYGRELIFSILAERITKICNETNCGIVWSSSWRNLPEYQDINKAKEMFNRRNLPGERLIAYTHRRVSYANRASLIFSWIKEYGQYIKKFAIIDDRDDAEYNSKNCKFFQTNIEDGITENLMNKIIKWLNK